MNYGLGCRPTSNSAERTGAWIDTPAAISSATRKSDPTGTVALQRGQTRAKPLGLRTIPRVRMIGSPSALRWHSTD